MAEKKKRRPSKAKTAARRLVPVAVIVPGTAYGTMQAVSFVSSPSHLYNATQQAAAAAKIKAAKAAEEQYLAVAKALNRSASQLASLQAASSQDQAGLNTISSGITAIQNQKPAPAPAGAGSSSGNTVRVPSVPIGSAPSATTTASMLAAG
ncbi:MAG: hypothetical protein M0Z34_05965 [Nitrospiraceae bacterium]|nr:hypothetical protein [Nitrospiraceae bacterium]MDA8262037.1 hypothetical protein [Actinomycetota bacterium]